MCRLDDGRKVRLCAYVRMKVAPGFEDVTVQPDLECRRQNFRLGNEWYNDWTLECAITIHQMRLDRSVTRGYRDNEVFVFTTDDNGVVAGRFSLGLVSVITDP